MGVMLCASPHGTVLVLSRANTIGKGSVTRYLRSGRHSQDSIKVLTCENKLRRLVVGRTHKASATISDLRRRSPVEIEYRYVLPSK